MKVKLQLMAVALLITASAAAQWSQKAPFPGIARAKSTAFTIDDKIYVMGGVTNASAVLKDFWVYDMAANSWMQKPNFPGDERYGATSFVLNNKGYIATGGNDFGFLDDLWEYDPATDSWTQKTGLPVTQPQHDNQRREAFSFVIGNYAYLGGGDGWVFGANSTNNYAFFDLWQYNPATNTWTAKTGIPDFLGRDFAIGLSLNNKGYVGLGCNVDQNVNRQSFWEYDAATDAWTAKAAFPTQFTTDAGAFALDSMIYVTGGVNLTPVSLSSQVYKYDPLLDTWTALANFNGGAIAGQFAVSNGSTAYIGTGYNGSVVTRSDVWQFGAATAINENEASGINVQVYPNPASDRINLSADKDIASIAICDVTGKTIMFTDRHEQISISHLSKGIYNIKLTFEDGSLYCVRFTKA